MLSLKNISSVFSRGRSNDGREAKELLETVDDLLSQSNKLLNSISRRIPSGQLETFEFKYTELNLMVIDVKDDLREREQKRIIFESEEEKETFQSDIRKLLRQCEVYRNDVVSASRRVQGGIPTGSTLEETSGNTASQSSSQAESQVSPWLSIVADTASQGDSLISDSTHKDGPTKRFIATVSRNLREGIVSGDETSSSQDDNSYFRILICSNGSKRAVVVDTNLHNPDDTDSHADNLLQLGDMLMKSDPKELEGHQIVDSYQGPSFIASFMSSFAYKSSNMLTGGML